MSKPLSFARPKAYCTNLHPLLSSFLPLAKLALGILEDFPQGNVAFCAFAPKKDYWFSFFHKENALRYSGFIFSCENRKVELPGLYLPSVSQSLYENLTGPL